MKPLNMGKVICSPCQKVFEDKESYLSHKCDKADGFTPRDQEYLIKTTTPHLKRIADSALKRGKVKSK